MFKIKKAIIRIDYEDYINSFNDFKGYIDASDTGREPSEVRLVGTYNNLAKAEDEIDNCVYIDIDEDNNDVIIMYEYIEGMDEVYFDTVIYNGDEYSIDENMYSPECYKEIKKDLSINENISYTKYKRRSLKRHIF